MAVTMPMECIQVSGVNARYAGKTMKVKALRKALKKAPDDADVKVLTYGYSQGRRELYDIDDYLIERREEYIIVVITAGE